MNRKEVNLFNMFRATDQFLETNKAALAGFNPIIASHNRIKAGNAVIDNLSKTQAIGTKVKSGLKKLEKEELDTIAYKVTDALTALAASTNDPELRMIALLEKSTLKRLREVDYNIKIQAIYKAALPYADKLAMWGVTMEDVEALNTKSTSYVLRTPDIRNVQVITKQASTEIHKKVIEIRDEIQDTLDALMKPFNTLNPTLYGQYINARTIVEIAATQSKKAEGPEADAAKESA